MMSYPITPPPDLVEEWSKHWPQDALLFAAQWGADQELEACLEWLKGTSELGIDLELVKARRPKPPSLKEQALDAHNRMMAGTETQDDWTIVRRALEQLND
jgi:hypothetical protein